MCASRMTSKQDLIAEQENKAIAKQIHLIETPEAVTMTRLKKAQKTISKQQVKMELN